MFLRMLGQNGFTVNNADGAVTDAYNTCAQIQDGTDPATLLLNLVRGTGMTQQMAARLVVQQVIFFCPTTDSGFRPASKLPTLLAGVQQATFAVGVTSHVVGSAV